MKIFSKTPKAFVLPVALLCSSVWADVSYIGESGEVAYVKDGDYTVLSNTSIENLNSGWYVIQGEVTFNSKIWAGGNVSIILADGASLIGDATGSDKVAGIAVAENISIYGQSKQTGKLSISGFSQGITSSGNVTICGGVVEISATKDGIYAAGEVSVTGGSIIASGTSEAGVYAGEISFSGASNTVVNASSVFIANDPKTISIAEGKKIICENQLYSGTVEPSVVNGKTIKSYNPPIQADGNSIIVDGDYNGLNTIEESLLGIVFGDQSSRTFNNIAFKRTFPLNKYSTFMLPFEVNTNQLSGIGTLLRYNGITEDNGKVVIQMSRVWTSDSVAKDLAAYTPYMVLMYNPTLTVQGPVTLSKNVSVTPVSSDECIANPSGTYCAWKMYGSQAYKKWTADDLASVIVYGFAAEEKQNVSIGKFVKVGAGASIRAFRGFLANGDGSAPAQGRARYNRPVMSSIEQPELPAEIDIVIVEDDEQTTVIGKMNTRTGEIMMKRDFDLKGRRVGNNKAVHGA